MNKILLALYLVIGLMVVGPTSLMAADDAAKDEDGVQFVELNPLMLPIISKHGGTQMVSLIVSVEVNSSDKADQVKKYSPRLTDAFLTDLYSAFGYQTALNGGKIPLTYLKKRLNKISAKVLGDDVVDDVLLQFMQQRRT